MRLSILFLFLVSGALFGDSEVYLKKQQPNWRIQIVEEYTNGTPHKVELLAPKPRSQEWEKVKEKLFRVDGTLLRETDLVEGVKEGTSILYYPDQKIHTIVSYKEGKIEGLSRTFDEQGVLRDLFNYKNDLLEGPYEFYDSKGVLFEKGFFLNGKKEGEVNFFVETGEVIRKENYVNGLLQGPLTEYYLNGNPSGIWQYYKGLLHGTSKTIAAVKYASNRKTIEEQDFRMGQPWGLHRVYNSEGVVTMEQYVDTFPEIKYETTSQSLAQQQIPLVAPEIIPAKTKVKHGKFETFYENGNKKSLLEYNEGLLHGKKMLWDPYGDVIEEAHYVDGNLEGRYRKRESNGSERITYYKNNQMHGLLEVTHPEHEFFGKMKALECRYDEGILEGDLIEYNIAGIKIAQTPYKKGVREGKALYFTEKGVLFRSADFHKDQLEGDYKEFFPNGAVKSEVSYRQGQREGRETHYFDHGGVKSVTHFKNGAIHGVKKEWDSAGLLIFEGNFHEGKRHGLFQHFDESGNKIKEARYNDDQKVTT
jgi:antitoxin component YwqK of YwqJK toxin-antitoxin module